MNRIHIKLSITFIFIALTISKAQNKSENKYHLFNPVPKDQMREMHTDRPDITETPFTVDAGHFQFEFDFINFYRHPITRDKKETDILLLNGIAKVGITERVDLEFIFSANQWHFPNKRQVQTTEITRRTGFGDLGLRTKINLIGNEHEEYGLALMPSLLIPLNNNASDDVYITGIALIWEFELSEKWTAGGQFEYFRLSERNRDFLFSEYWGTFEIDYKINDNFNVFNEYIAIVSESLDYLHTYNAGIIYKVSKNLHFDLAFNYGLNSKSPNTIFTGFSFRV